eukprot:TRINITY_DN466_c0_g1_i1.p1 TRINITY_DN466_c0_g1~~TRINITY_DN466_c0_g1_i1.p1  ORF type:complete len:303 (-),score=103.23 TRINITY_DN466_c0_g1_i1:33-830(-)
MVEMAQQGAQSEQYARRIEELEQSLGSALNQGARAAELEQKLAEATLALENNKQVVALSRKIEEIEGRSQMDLRNWEKKNAEMTLRLNSALTELEEAQSKAKETSMIAEEAIQAQESTESRLKASEDLNSSSLKAKNDAILRMQETTKAFEDMKQHYQLYKKSNDEIKAAHNKMTEENLFLKEKYAQLESLYHRLKTDAQSKITDANGIIESYHQQNIEKGEALSAATTRAGKAEAKLSKLESELQSTSSELKSMKNLLSKALHG